MTAKQSRHSLLSCGLVRPVGRVLDDEGGELVAGVDHGVVPAGLAGLTDAAFGRLDMLQNRESTSDLNRLQFVWAARC